MKRIFSFAVLGTLASAGAAYAAAPGPVGHAVKSCCEVLAACCQGGMPCC